MAGITEDSRLIDNPSQSGAEGEEEDLIKLLEKFSEKLGAVEKDVLETPGRNRRRRGGDERNLSHDSVKVEEEVRILQDEVHGQRRLRSSRRSKFGGHRIAQMVFLVLVAVLIYLYGSKISTRLPALKWKSDGQDRDFIGSAHVRKDLKIKSSVKAATENLKLKKGAILKKQKLKRGNSKPKI